MRRGWFACCLAVGMATGGCSEADSDDSRPTPPGGNSAANTECSGEFARVESPYVLNTALSDFGGFAADGHGLVFSAWPDESLTDAPEEYPQRLFASSLSGQVTELYSTDSMISSLVADEKNAYFSTLISGTQLLSVPRAGGAPTVLIEDGVRTGPITDGTRLYVEMFVDGDPAIVAVDRSGGATDVITTWPDKYIASFAIEAGALYVLISDGFDVETDHTLYKVPIAGGAAEVFATVPRSAGGGLDVVDGVVYSRLLSESYDVVVYRIERGRPPVLVSEEGGLPMVFDGDAVYYPEVGRLTKNNLSFNDAKEVPGAAGRLPSAIAVGPTDLWYASYACIYRAPK